jgi:hypothetical protein
METSDLLVEQLRNMVTNNLHDRVVCDKSALRLMVLEAEVAFQTKRADALEVKLNGGLNERS